MKDGKPVVNIQQNAHSEWYMNQPWNIAAWHFYQVTGDGGLLAKAYEATTGNLAKQEKWYYPEIRSWIAHRLATGHMVEGLCRITAHHTPSPNDACLV